jgi:hypothetical protein
MATQLIVGSFMPPESATLPQKLNLQPHSSYLSLSFKTTTGGGLLANNFISYLLSYLSSIDRYVFLGLRAVPQMEGRLDVPLEASIDGMRAKLQRLPFRTVLHFNVNISPMQPSNVSVLPISSESTSTAWYCKGCMGKGAWDYDAVSARRPTHRRRCRFRSWVARPALEDVEVQREGPQEGSGASG